MWLLVVNRKSGMHRALSLVNSFSELLSRNGHIYEIVDEDTANQTDIKLQELLKTGTYSKVIAFGGDGLVHLCIQHLVDTGIAFGVVAAGTGNDFARTLGVYKMTVDKLYELYSLQSDHAIDVGKIIGNEKQSYFVQVLSTGFDANVNSLANRIKWPKGILKYTIATFLTINRFRSISYSIEIDGEIETKEAMLVSVANGACYGGGMKIQPMALNSDGALDILIVNPVSKLTLTTLFPKIFFGTHTKHPKVAISRGHKISLSANTQAYADGEFISDLPIEITILPKSLRTWHAR